MSQLNYALVIAARRDAAAALIGGARSLAHRVGIVFAGEDMLADAADVGFRLGTAGLPFSAAASAIVRLVAEEQPDLVLAEDSADGRLVVGALAAATRTNPLAGVSQIAVEDGRVVAKRLVYGGSAIQTVAADGPAIVTASAGLYEARSGAPCGDIRDVAVEPPEGVKFLGRSAKAGTGEDLSSEKIVVGVGRGVGSAAGLAAVRAFATVIGAGVGATRPAAEESPWYDGRRYIGISGDTIKPNIYIACGVSGQVQHMVGVNQAGLIFAVNNDAKAPIFQDCDYGIIGDVNRVLPELTARFDRA
ncbi:MAG: electron transfer flavoprotein subunit alpha/FixB family protein [Bifidobacteriaceae bacterium]|jgi:electron transfer flavoprotein alpha subunit|nr:electron transfer flavoprotein subunit alpha/FixB family protein [Bifidobacteriaceae bacterium]